MISPPPQAPSFRLDYAGGSKNVSSSLARAQKRECRQGRRDQSTLLVNAPCIAWLHPAMPGIAVRRECILDEAFTRSAIVECPFYP
ncbi:hypothetical protein MRX96_020452 [Rhipicephalus microplus]